MKHAYEPLFESFTLPCGLSLGNRISLAPMTTWSSNEDGTVHDDEIDYLARRSSGPSLVMTAACYVQPDGYAFNRQWGCHTDEMLPSLKRVADTIHSRGGKAILQIHHGGRMCPSKLLGHPPVSASAVAALRPDADVPRAMEHEEILETIKNFGEATRRAIEAGYDGVEIHGANTYLPQQFFSPHSNRRTDQWGGTLGKRLRFPMEIVQAVKAAASRSAKPFAVGYRFSPEEIEEPGITMIDTLALVDNLVECNLDWLHVSVRNYKKGSIRDKSDERRPTKIVVDRVGGRTPVIGVGLVYTPDDAMFLMEDGCDIVAMGRILLMEPEWVDKVRNGRESDIRKTLKSTGADKDLTLPGPLYKRLLAVKGWLPVEDTPL